MVRRCLLALVSLFAIAACSTSTPGGPSTTPSAPSVPPSSAPPSASSTAPAGPQVGADQLQRADPCGFFDAKALGAFGNLTVERDQNYSSSGRLDVADGGSVNLSLDLEDKRSGSPDEEPTKVGDLTVYREPGDTDLCTREVMARPDVVVHLYASQDPKPDLPCAVADAWTKAVAEAVSTGTVPASEYPASSLAWRDACELLTRGEAKAPGATGDRHPAFAGHSCVWGTDNVTAASVFVQLAPAEPVDGKTKIAGHPASVEQHPANENASLIGPSLARCEVNLGYQPLKPAHQNWVEGLTVTVTADASPGSLCPKATELAAKVISRLSS